MKQYNNNYGRGTSVNSPMRFSKRPRYAGNNSSGSSFPRFNSPPGYQQSQNRNNATDYKSTQYENNHNKHFYNNSPKNLNYNLPQQSKQSSAYSHNSSISSLSPSSVPYKKTVQKALNLSTCKSKALTTQTPPASSLGKKSHHQQQFTPNIDSSNCLAFGYDYFSTTYNADLIATVANTTFSATESLNPYMWQTITSTPPPMLPQQQQQRQPVYQQAPEILPPLPTSDKMPYLPPPPPIPVSISDIPSPTRTSEVDDQNKSNDQDSAAVTIVKMKTKRKPMSTRCKPSKAWSENDALLALKAEEDYTKNLQKNVILIIRFPDPHISREIVKTYSPEIESVHFHLNSAPRYCLVHLKPDADVKKTIEQLSKISFGTGFLSVEVKQIPSKLHSTKLTEIDPFTLYVGNLPTTIASKTLKGLFPGAARIDIGFAQRMKYTRYAFIRYQSVDLAIEAYKKMLGVDIGGRSTSIRFRRLIVAGENRNDGEIENSEYMQDNLLSQQTIASDDNSTVKLFQTSLLQSDPTNVAGDTNNDNTSSDLPTVNESHAIENDKNIVSSQENFAVENNSIETNATPLKHLENATQAKKNTIQVNIKPDPYVDPEDIVVRHTNAATTSNLESVNNNIKQEQLYMEFFEKPHNQKDSPEKSNRSDMHSLSSITDETDTMSTLSSNSLGEFLQTCNRRQMNSDNIEDLEPPPAKIIKLKRDPLERNNIGNKQNLVGACPERPVKQERALDCEIVNTGKYKNSSAPETHKTVPLSGKQVAAGNNFRSSRNSKNNDDDAVPSTALFFSNDYQNIIPNSINVCDYDEFYETSVLFQSTTALANIKKEPLDTPTTQRSVNVVNKTMQRKERSESFNTVSNTMISQSKSDINSISTAEDDDDFVPAKNLLGSYRPLHCIKTETEDDDIFSVPFNRSIVLNETTSRTNDPLVNLTSYTSNCESNNTELPKGSAVIDHDDDVIIISDNINRSVKNTKPINTISTNLFIPQQTDLVTFNRKPVSVTINNRDASKVIHYDQLDRLYEQLDADSDSEL